MSDVPVSRILKALLRKGFERRDTHHIMLWFVPGGRSTAVTTRFSHSAKSADDWLLGRISKELGLSRKELLALIECTLSEEAYLQLLIARNYIQP